MSAPTQSPGSFFGSLFDFSFSQFVTTRIVRVLYILAIIAVTIWALVLFVGGITQGGGGAVVAIILAPLVWLLGVVYARVLLEFIVIVFRIAEHTGHISRNTAVGAGAGTASPPTSAVEPPPPTDPDATP